MVIVGHRKLDQVDLVLNICVSIICQSLFAAPKPCFICPPDLIHCNGFVPSWETWQSWKQAAPSPIAWQRMVKIAHALEESGCTDMADLESWALGLRDSPR